MGGEGRAAFGQGCWTRWGELGAEAPEGCRECGRRCPLWGLAGLRSSPGVGQRTVIAVCHGFLHVGRGQSFSLCQQNSKAGLIFQAGHGVHASFFRPFLFLCLAPLSEGCVIPVVALEGVCGACPRCKGGSLVSLGRLTGARLSPHPSKPDPLVFSLRGGLAPNSLQD